MSPVQFRLSAPPFTIAKTSKNSSLGVKAREEFRAFLIEQLSGSDDFAAVGQCDVFTTEVAIVGFVGQQRFACQANFHVWKNAIGLWFSAPAAEFVSEAQGCPA